MAKSRIGPTGTPRRERAPRPTADRGGTRPRILGEQGERTRAKLLDAARAVFADRTYPHVRVDDITRVAGTSHGAFYLYFNNKAEALEALATQTSSRMGALGARLDGIDKGEHGHDRLRAWIDDFVGLYAEDAPVLSALMAAGPEDERLDRLGRDMMSKLAGRVSRAIAAGADGRRTSQSGLVATALVAMLERICYSWLVRGADLKRPDVVDALAVIWSQAIFGHPRPA